MQAFGSAGLTRLVLRSSLVVVLLAAGMDAAQSCPTAATISNFRFVSSTQTFPRQVTYAWDVPQGAAAGTLYEVLRAVSADYCTGFSAFQVVAETTATSQTVTLDASDRVYQFWVRVKDCSVAAPGAWIDDSFTMPPSSPVIEILGTGANQVSLSLTQGDSRTAAVVVERAGTNGLFQQIDTKYFYDICPAGNVVTGLDFNLAPGTYNYRAWAFNQGTTQQIYSSIVTVTIGGTSEPGPVIDFYSADPAAVTAGGASTLSWSATGGTAATIDQGVGQVATSGSVVVHPTITTTYTLTVTGNGGATVGRVQVLVTPVPLLGEVAATIVTVVSAPGLYGAYYRTAVQLSNPSGSPSLGRLVYHPKERSGSAGDSFVRYTLQPHQTLEFPNVLGLIGSSGNGSLDVVPEGGSVPVVRARVFNDAGPLGTTGVTEYGLPPADSLKTGETGLLIAPADPQKFRFAVGLRTLDSGATLTFTLRNGSGGMIKTFTRSYPATFYIQRSGTEFFDGATFAGDESVTVEVNAGSAYVYSTVADNITNDPSLQIARRLP